MPFESSLPDDSVVSAELRMSVNPDDVDSTRAIANAAKDLQIALESATRFSESYLDFQKQSLDVQKELAKAQDELLKKTAEQDKLEEQRRQSQMRDQQDQERQQRDDRQREKQERQEDSDYRQRLAQEMSDSTRQQLTRRSQLEQQAGSPEEVFEMLRERGFVTESVKNGAVNHEINIPGGGKFSAADLENEANMAKALDQLSKSTGAETGGLVDQLGGVSSNLALAMSGLRRGGSVGDSLKASQGLLGNLSKSGGTAGALAGAAGVAGKALPFVGAGLAGWEIYNQGMDFYNQYRQQGQVKGGGFSEGIGYEMQIRSMALNPFISTDQARQIIMGAVNEGYTGQQFDNITELVQKNFTSMGIDINKSFKMINTVVQQGGESLEEFATAMEKVKAGAKVGNMSVQEAADEFQNVAQSVVDAGYGEFSTEVTDQITSRFKGEKDIPLKGVMGRIAAAFMNNNSLWVPLTRYGQQLGVNSTPPLIVGDLMAQGQFVPAIELYLAELAAKAEQSTQGGAVREPWMIFWQMLTNYQIGSFTKNEAKLLYDRYGNGAITQTQNNAAGYIAERDEQAGIDTESQKEDIAKKASQKGYDSLSDSEKALVSREEAAMRLADTTFGLSKKQDKSVNELTKKWEGELSSGFLGMGGGLKQGNRDYLLQNLGKTGASIPELRNLTAASDGFQIYDEHGNPVSLKGVDWNNLGNAAKIADGRWKFTDLGADKRSGKSFEDFYNTFREESANERYLKDIKAGKNVAEPQVVRVEIQAKGDLAKYLQATEGGTANQKRSNMGEGGATENNPSVGDR